MKDIYFLRIPFTPDIVGTLWSEWLTFAGQYLHYIHISVVYIPCDRSWDLQLVRDSQRYLVSVVDCDPGL